LRVFRVLSKSLQMSMTMNLRNSLRGWTSVSALVVCVAAGAIGWLGHAAGVPLLLEACKTNGQVQADLTWQADQARQYEVLTTTNVASANWWLATPNPLQPTNLVGHWQTLSTNRAQFFRLAQRDMQGPEITARYPATNGIAVGRFAALTVAVTDETGVDTNAFALTVSGVTVTNGSPGVTVSTAQFQYAPGTNAWGDYGGTATVAFVCADVRSNLTLSSWSFGLEVQPVVTNVLLHLPPPPGGHVALASAAKRHGVEFLQGLTIVSFETNRVVFNYSGETHGLFVGAILVSHDPARFFYRQIAGLEVDPLNHMVTAYTTDVPLTTLVKDGSFSPEVFVPAAGAGVAKDWEVTLGYAIPFSHKTEFSVLPLEFGHVRVTPGNLALDLEGSAQVACVVKDWQVVALDASVASKLVAELRAKFEFFGKVDLLNNTTTVAAVPLGYAVGFIGPVPVWVELQLGVDLGLEVAAEAAVVFETGLDAYASADFRLAWRPEGWNHSYNGSFDVAPVPLDIGFEASAEAFLYLKPRLSALVYSLAGVSADYRRGPALEGKWRAGDPQCEIALYDKWAINAGITIVGVPEDELPSVTFVEEKRTIQTWYWPPITNQAPVFTRHPPDVTAAAGTTVTLEAGATGNPEPTYQWFQNGLAIPFQTQPTLTFTMGEGTVGSYYVIAKNRLGWVRSNPATVSLGVPEQVPVFTRHPSDVTAAAGETVTLEASATGNPEPTYQWFQNGLAIPLQTQPTLTFTMGEGSVGSYYVIANNRLGWVRSNPATVSLAVPPPVGMVWIPPGTFTMGSPDSEQDRFDDEGPQTVVTLTHGFFMGQHEVTQAEYQAVIGSNPSYFSGDPNRPVEQVSWDDATNYCGKLTAAERAAGRLPTGYVYRLPTEAEWEYACRAGTTTRFFYGDDPGYTQLGNYDWYGSNSGSTTHAVGLKQPNPWGLYDMAGNVQEWCLDLWGTYPGWSVTDPRGPASGSYRVVRGGCWLDDGWDCRSALRLNFTPGDRRIFIGFRAVLAPGQP
jgi:formylglycine-generating enzyme required for sulfatase activity